MVILVNSTISYIPHICSRILCAHNLIMRILLIMHVGISPAFVYCMLGNHCVLSVMLRSITRNQTIFPSLHNLVDNVNGRNSLITVRTVHNGSLDFIIQFFMPRMIEMSRILLPEQFVGNSNFQLFVFIPVNASVRNA